MHCTLSARHDSFRLHTPFRISRGTKTVADVITVCVTAGGLTGRGEAVPYPRYGETIAGALAAIDNVAAALDKESLLAGKRARLQELLPAGAARNAVDCALWDLEAQQRGTTVAALAGLSSPSSMPTAMTVSLDTPSRMAEAAAKLAYMPLLKVKVDNTAPAQQIEAVRRAAPQPRLIVDPNESWTIATLEELAPLLQKYAISLLEQPLPATADAALEGFHAPVPIAADESAHTLDDLAQVAKRYQVINIKLDKTGGLTQALTLKKAAQTAGLQLMVGCMISSSLSIAPAMLLGSSAAFVDLDGPLWLADDREGGVHEKGGILFPLAAGFWGEKRVSS